MGSGVQCRAHFGKQSSEGKALLDTNELVFRGVFRLKIPFPQMKSLKAAHGELRIEFPEGRAAFELGPQAEKWAHKILHPKPKARKDITENVQRAQRGLEGREDGRFLAGALGAEICASCFLSLIGGVFLRSGLV